MLLVSTITYKERSMHTRFLWDYVRLRWLTTTNPPVGAIGQTSEEVDSAAGRATTGRATAGRATAGPADSAALTPLEQSSGNVHRAHHADHPFWRTPCTRRIAFLISSTAQMDPFPKRDTHRTFHGPSRPRKPKSPTSGMPRWRQVSDAFRRNIPEANVWREKQKQAGLHGWRSMSLPSELLWATAASKSTSRPTSSAERIHMPCSPSPPLQGLTSRRPGRASRLSLCCRFARSWREKA